jgi:hypothetical protein
MLPDQTPVLCAIAAAHNHFVLLARGSELALKCMQLLLNAMVLQQLSIHHRCRLLPQVGALGFQGPDLRAQLGLQLRHAVDLLSEIFEAIRGGVLFVFRLKARSPLDLLLQGVTHLGGFPGDVMRAFSASSCCTMLLLPNHHFLGHFTCTTL